MLNTVTGSRAVDELVQSTAMEWILTFLEFAQNTVIAFTPRIIPAILPNLASPQYVPGSSPDECHADQFLAATSSLPPMKPMAICIVSFSPYLCKRCTHRLLPQVRQPFRIHLQRQEQRLRQLHQLSPLMLVLLLPRCLQSLHLLQVLHGATPRRQLQTRSIPPRTVVRSAIRSKPPHLSLYHLPRLAQSQSGLLNRCPTALHRH